MRIYACLLGEWVDITEVGTVEKQDPITYFKENMRYEDGARYADCFKHDYIHVQYGGRDYRINPVFIQITNG